SGMKIKAQMAPAGTAVYIEEAWALIKAGLVRGLSIGFRPLEESYDRELGGYRYLRSEIMELSAVTIPANAEASITSVKSADSLVLAASGQRHLESPPGQKPNRPGVSGTKTTSNPMKTIAEQIASFEAKRAANMARMTELMEKAGEEGRTLAEAETQEYDGLQAEVKSIDEHLVRLRAHEQQAVKNATQVKGVDDPETGSTVRGAVKTGGVVIVKGPELPKGTAFVRYAMALMAAKGNRQEALEMVRANKAWKDSTPMVERVLRAPAQVLKAPVAAGTTTADGWAAELADYTYMANEFIEFLRPATIIGKIPGIRNVPFNVRIPLQDAGASVGWVGEGARKPLTKLHFDTIEFRFAKAAGIVVLTEELVRFSNPSAEALVRTDLVNAMAQFLDEQFIDPAVAANGTTSPASVTNGAPHDAASGTGADKFQADFKKIIASILGADIPVDATCCWIMDPVQAVSLSLMLNALDQPYFPNITAAGGTLLSYPVVTSGSVASQVITFLKGSEILLAEDGVNLDASREASLVMDDGGSPAVTTMHSLWQENKVGLRVERIVNWARRRDEAVYYLTGCDYK
ncbi:MAG TPA: phage major capsid protein, partial [Phycisphaerae bacterium]|nr:phage major capsid protein [Phycisphaerae bacterium]